MAEKKITTEAPSGEPEEQAEDAASQTPPNVSFPWGMFCLAALADLIGLIPFVNLLSEPIAGFIFGFWQKSYAPKTDPVMTFILAKIADIILAGFLPSNIGVVIYAWTKKKATAKLPGPVKQGALKKATAAA